MTRRFFLMAPLAAAVPGDDEEKQVIAVVSDMAGALSDSNAVAFFKPIDRSLPGYAELRAAVTALVEQNYVISTIDVLRNEGGANLRNVELDWFLQVMGKEPAATTKRRRQFVRCRLERRKKKWMVVGIEPADFFVPPKPPGR